ncbi:hypothetical protein ACNKXS_13885 [Christiangramia marina]|uniref:hypothetical protein n=1 Tax=Christiangramia marina TaxID=409436 RepID=UPI003AA8B122
MQSVKSSILITFFLFLCYGGTAQETLQSITENGATTNIGVGLYNGGAVANQRFVIDGLSMGYRTPLLVKRNLDYLGMVMDQAAMRFDIPMDALDNAPSSLMWVYPNSGIPYMRRIGNDHTILKIWSPREADNAYESTLALVNGDQSQEFLDLYNMSYPSNHSYGIRMQKRNGGAYKPFHFEYSDGTETYPVLTLNSDKTSYFYGDIGVGTTNTEGYKLAINGNAIAESMTVKLKANWPDYVFSDDYGLKSLDEVERFTKAHKRLPKVPSAVQIAKDGMNLGEINRITIEKVEEIFLYLIEQNKEIKNLQIEIQKLNNRITND